MAKKSIEQLKKEIRDLESEGRKLSERKKLEEKLFRLKEGKKPRKKSFRERVQERAHKIGKKARSAAPGLDSLSIG